MRWLVIDDSDLSGSMAAEILESLGEEARAFTSGSEAIGYLGTSPYDKADAILLDYRMPGLDGPAVAKMIRAAEGQNRSEHVLIVGMSGDSDEETVIRQQMSGVDEVISKPIEYSKLKAIISTYGMNAANSEVDDKTEASAGDEIAELPNWNYRLFDRDMGIRYSGSERLLIKYISNFVKTYKSMKDRIVGYLEADDLTDFTIEVHTLKSTSRMLGDMSLSRLAEAIEELGDANNRAEIDNLMPELLKEMADAYREAEDITDDYCSQRQEIAGEVRNTDAFRKLPGSNVDALIEILDALQEAAEGFEIDFADRCIEDMKKVGIPEQLEDQFEELERYSAEVNFNRLASETVKMRGLLSIK